MNMRSRQGFSLLEMLMVILILGALIGLAAPYYGDTIARGKRTTMKANLRTVKKALMDYHTDMGTYPVSLAVLTIPNPAGIRYLNEVPLDPEDGSPANWGFTVFTANGSSSYSLASKYSE